MNFKLIVAILAFQCNELYASEYIFRVQKISNIKEVKQETKIQNAKWSNFNVLVSRNYYDFDSIRTSSATYIPSNGVCTPVGDTYGELCTYENNGNLELELKILRNGCFAGQSVFDGYVMHNLTGLKSYEVLSGNLNISYVNQNNKFGFNLIGSGCVVTGDNKKVKLVF